MRKIIIFGTTVIQIAGNTFVSSVFFVLFVEYRDCGTPVARDDKEWIERPEPGLAIRHCYKGDEVSTGECSSEGDWFYDRATFCE